MKQIIHQITLDCVVDGQCKRAVIDVYVDLHTLAVQLGRRAMRAKTTQCEVAHGTLVVRARDIHTINVEDTRPARALEKNESEPSLPSRP